MSTPALPSIPSDPDEDFESRKSEHIELALDPQMQGLGIQRSGMAGPGMHRQNRSFDQLRLPHRALPEISLEAISTSGEFLGKPISAPLIIGAMTGGTAQAEVINRNLAAAAQEIGLAFGLGSQRAAIEDPTLVSTYSVREVAPEIPVIANLGMVQLNYGYGIDQCQRAVEMVQADGLAFHLNALQEAIQPEGQSNFSDLLRQLEPIVRSLEVPVMVKEIGHGIDRQSALALRDVGVTLIDAAGSGGTDWGRIEASRAGDRSLGEVFADWGIPSPIAIRNLEGISGIEVIGSGGIRNGLDGAKAISLGASWVAMAQPFLGPALESPEKVAEQASRWIRELRIAMFCCGAASLEQLAQLEIEGV